MLMDAFFRAAPDKVVCTLSFRFVSSPFFRSSCLFSLTRPDIVWRHSLEPLLCVYICVCVCVCVCESLLISICYSPFHKLLLLRPRTMPLCVSTTRITRESVCGVPGTSWQPSTVTWTRRTWPTTAGVVYDSFLDTGPCHPRVCPGHAHLPGHPELGLTKGTAIIYYYKEYMVLCGRSSRVVYRAGSS
jgi:hypothetical protein